MTSRISATVDDNVKDELDSRAHVNVSSLVNDLLTEYLFGSDRTTKETVLEYEEKRLKRELDELNESRSKKEERLEEIRQKQQKLEEQGHPDDLVESFGIIDRLPPGSVTVDNPAVMNHATNNGMSPEQFLDEFDSWRAEKNQNAMNTTELKSLS